MVNINNMSKIKKQISPVAEESPSEDSVPSVAPSIGEKELLADGWQETPEVRDNGNVRVFEKVVNGVREYKELRK